jgi:glucokinase
VPLIGIDVGGSAVKLGAIEADGSLRGETSIAIAAGEPRASIFERVAAAVRELTPGATPHGVGAGLPGLLDRARGGVVASPNLPWLSGADVRAELARRLDVAPERVHIGNDADCAAFGEQWLGAARAARHALVLTLGTGIGGGLILDGRLFTGEGMAGEIGHVKIATSGPPCGCGSCGCLETFASATAARRRALERGLPREHPGDLEELEARARAAEGPERALLAEIGRDLGRGVAQALCLLDVRLFVFGGGFAAALDLLEPGIRAGLGEWAYGERVLGVRLQRAALGSSAGWIGAARLALG